MIALTGTETRHESYSGREVVMQESSQQVAESVDAEFTSNDEGSGITDNNALLPLSYDLHSKLKNTTLSSDGRFRSKRRGSRNKKTTWQKP